MKSTVLTIAAIFTMSILWAQSPLVKIASGGLKTIKGIKNMETTIHRANMIAASEIPKQTTTQLKGHLSSQVFSSISTSMQNQDVTYKKEKSSERRGNGYMTMYHLMVTNHSNKDLYVFGSVHIIGEVEQEGRHFAGSVPAHSTVCLLTTIDEDFNGVRIRWQDDM